MALSEVEARSLCSASVIRENTDVSSESRNIDVPSESPNIDVSPVFKNTDVPSVSTNTALSPTLHSEVAGSVSPRHDKEHASPPSLDIVAIAGSVSPRNEQEHAPPPSLDEVVIAGSVSPRLDQENTPPPSLVEVVNPEASPPTNRSRPVRDSLLRLVREARRIVCGFVAYLTACILILLGTSAAIVCSAIKYAIAIGIPVAMIVIGSMYLGECPAEKFIPVYLIVGGVCGVLEITTIFQMSTYSLFHFIFQCFIFAWFIAGNIWICKVYEPEYEDESSQFYCNKTLYLFAFWLLTIPYILTGICILIAVVLLILHLTYQ